MSKKQLPKQTKKAKKQISENRYSSDTLCPVWYFTKIDRDGAFAFDLNRDDFEHSLVLEKMIEYSNMTWQEVKQQTHGRKGKSKNHFLSSICKIAEDRLKVLGLEEYSDSIFSFALKGIVRVVGYRDDERFFVLWYDPKHEIYPVD